MKTFSILRALAFGLLVAASAAQAQDVVLYGRLTTTGDGLQFDAGTKDASISPDGRYVPFVSSSTNIGPPSNGSTNVYLYDLGTDQYLLAMANIGTGNSSLPTVSSGGFALAFESLADDIGGGNPGSFADVFYSEAFDAGQGEVAFNTYLVSHGVGGAAPNGGSRYASISADGRWVAYYSDASNLIAGDTNGVPDIFVADSSNYFGGAPERVSVDNAGVQINGPSRALSSSAISADGRYVAFAVDTPVSIDGSNAGTLEDVFVRDRTAGTTTLISKSSAGEAGSSSADMAAISPSGRYVAFRSFSTNLTPNPSGSRIYVRDRQTNTTSNMPLPPDAASCEDPHVSDNGDVVTQCSMNLLGVYQQAFLYRPESGFFYVLSTSLTDGYGNGTSGNSMGISADGSLMTFDSEASDLVASDTNATSDVFGAPEPGALLTGVAAIAALVAMRGRRSAL